MTDSTTCLLHRPTCLSSLPNGIYAAVARDTKDMEVAGERSQTAVSGIAPLTQIFVKTDARPRSELIQSY